MLAILGAMVLLPAFPTRAQDDAVTLTVVTHDSFAVSEDVLAQFEQESGITVRILRSGDAGTMVNQAILSKSNPLGDVLYGVDNTFLSRALEAGLFIPYESSRLDAVGEEFIPDVEHRVTPVDFGDVCLNFDRAFFEERDLPLPTALRDLADPIYEDLLVVENPATSSPGLAFLLATVAAFGTEGDFTYLDFWRELAENGVLVTEDWSAAYFGEFTVASGGSGSRPLVVSYASSPPAEVFFAEQPPQDAPTGSIVVDGSCFRQIEYVGILDGTEQVEAAQRFVDFMLSEAFQEDMPLQMFVFPVIEEAELPEVFEQHAAIPDNPVRIDIEEIGAGRDEWIQAWTETVLR